MITLTALAIGVALQGAVLVAAAPQALVGDERDYCRPRRHPRDGAPWIRVPLFGGLVRALGRLTGTTGAARLLVSGSSLLALCCVTAWLDARHGAAAATMAALLYLTLIERAVLAIHLKPDSPMGLAWVASAICLVSEGPFAMAGLALSAVLAIGLRIEGVALAALALAAPLILPGRGAADLLLVLPILGGGIAIYLIWNRITLHTWALDTTTGFNLRVAQNDVTSAAATIGETMRMTQGQRRNRRKGIASAALPPVAIGQIPARIAARARLLLGAETYVTQNLSHANLAGYALPFRRFLARKTVDRALRHGFSMLFLAMCIALFHLPPVWIGLMGAAIGIYSALVTRSRYRMSILPMVVLFLVEGWSRMIAAPDPLALAGGFGLLLAVLALLRGAPQLQEIQPRGPQNGPSSSTPSEDI